MRPIASLHTDLVGVRRQQGLRKRLGRVELRMRERSIQMRQFQQLRAVSQEVQRRTRLRGLVRRGGLHRHRATASLLVLADAVPRRQAGQRHHAVSCFIRV